MRRIEFNKNYTVVYFGDYTFNFGVDVRDFSPNDFKDVTADEDVAVTIDHQGANLIIDELEKEV